MRVADRAQPGGKFSLKGLKALFRGVASEPVIAIAISGGSDSTALLHLACEWSSGKGCGAKLVALTVDHGLRESSADEAKLVARQCAMAGVEHHTLRWTGPKPASGIQAKARTARYNLMSDFCRSKGIGVLLTGHTADDQAETVSMRARRTCTAESLAGIWPERLWNGVRVCRPLLKLRRPALQHYLVSKGRDWVEDPSNENTRFERVRVRRELRGTGVAALAEQAEHALSETRRRQEAVRVFLSRHGVAGRTGVMRLPSAATSALGGDLSVALCRAVISELRGKVTAERAELLRLAQWLESGGPGRRTLNGLVFDLRPKEIVIGREPGRIAPVWQDIEGESVWDGRFSITAPWGCKVGPALLAPEIPREPDVPFWIWRGLPVLEVAPGRRIVAVFPSGTNRLELLGITVRPTYVNVLEGFPVA